MTTAGLACGSCGIDLRDDAKFCDGCGAPITPVSKAAEYKQVTVLFADVVHSMDIAAAVGAERLREIMAELFNLSSAVVQRYGGTLDKFTGDGVMAVFGAPRALEDHALRACLAALDIQKQAGRLAAEVQRCDGLALELRVGLNSGEVIAGEIGSGPAGYTAVGEQVGLAQRMESAAPPGAVMLSESTARLVEAAVLLGEPEMVWIKGSSTPVGARRLLAMTTEAEPLGRQRSTLVGRDGELNTLAQLLEQSNVGNGRVVRLVGPPGIGKSRLVLETTAIAAEGAVDVCTTYCESHSSDIPFHVATRLFREVFSVGGLEPDVGAQASAPACSKPIPKTCCCLTTCSALGFRQPVARHHPAWRTQRLTSLLNDATVARRTPAIFVIEDAHWIDQISEALIAEFATVVPQTHILVLVTYRPDYRGGLDRLPSSTSHFAYPP